MSVPDEKDRVLAAKGMLRVFLFFLEGGGGSEKE